MTTAAGTVLGAVAIFACGFMIATYVNEPVPALASMPASFSPPSPPLCPVQICPRAAAAPPAMPVVSNHQGFGAITAMRSRDEIASLVERLGLKTGAELGVQRGQFAAHMLRNWPSCTRYHLVDIWKQQDGANVNDQQQDQLFQETKQVLAQWADKTEFHRMFTNEAVKLIPDNSLDFIYVDARHDYCGCKEDLVNWWPKLRVGGIMAGHDLIEANDRVLVGRNEEKWDVCQDGSLHPGAVYGAVQDFVLAKGATVSVTYREEYPSYVIRKERE